MSDRVVESTLRTANNLLEPLHASSFFYILTDHDRFLNLGSYLPSAVLVSVAMMFSGLATWVDAARRKTYPDATHNSSSTKSGTEWSTGPRPVLAVLGVMFATHVIGASLFCLLTTRSWVIEKQVRCRMQNPIHLPIDARLPRLRLFWYSSLLGTFQR